MIMENLKVTELLRNMVEIRTNTLRIWKRLLLRSTNMKKKRVKMALANLKVSPDILREQSLRIIVL